jgi:hypothetical protein
MSNPAVVILTDPARCQLAEAETLVQALLQVQQLNNAGVPASQAFCDHPAAAMAFIEAYSKAYPALQLQTSDLPLPQHLYSMVADGRLSPFRPVEAADSAKSEQAGQLYPLYVLSLGAPEALMHALQHNSLAQSSIRVLEIPPIEQARAEPVSVAEAVAAAPLARSSWLTESSRAPEGGDQEAPGTEQLTENPVKLSSVEVDLDRIQIDSAGQRHTYDQSHQVQGEPAPALITAVAGPDPGPTSVGRHTTAEAPASSIGVPGPASQPAGTTTPPSESVSDTRHELPTDPSGTGVTRSDVPLVGAEPPGDGGANTANEPAPSDMGPSHPPAGKPADLVAGSDGYARPAPAEKEPDVDDAAPAGPGGPEGDGGDALARRSCIFAEPGEDVLYRPTASFSGDGDLRYARPPEHAGEPSFTLFDLAHGAEVVDLEALYRDFSEPTAEGRGVLKQFDFVLMRAPNSDSADPNDGSCAYLEDDAPVTQDNPGPDEDEALHDALTSVHDADV